MLTSPASTTTEDNNTDTKTDQTIGSDDNTASFSLSGKTLTVTGRGDLSKATVTTNDIVFQASAVNKIFKAGEGDEKVSVSKGEAYDKSTTYYGATITPTGSALNSGVPTMGDNYNVVTTVENKVPEDYKVYACYYSSTYDASTSTNVYNTVCFNNYGDNDNITDISSLASQNNWNQTQNNTYYYYCLVKGTMTTSSYTFTNGKYTSDGLEIIILTTENRDLYLPTVITVTSLNDQLCVKTGENNSTIVSLPKGATHNYKSGDEFHLCTVTANNDALDNDTYFGENGDGASLIGPYTETFLGFLQTELNKQPTTVIFKTEEGAKDKAQINNEITRALVSASSVVTLNLQDTYLESINAYDPAAYETSYNDPTFLPGADRSYNPTTNTTLTTLYMPATNEGTTLSEYKNSNNNTYRVFTYLQGLKTLHLSEGITTLGENAISNVSQNNLPKLTSITLPNSLKKAEAYCLNGQSDILTLTFPTGMEEIARHAFWGTNPKDVYFLGTEAPKVAAHAWGESSYISNNAMTNKVTVGDTEETSITVNKETGVAVRQNYETQNGWYAMLHYPAACAKEQAAKYTDITRSYKKIVYGVENETFKVKKSESNDGTNGIEYYYYEVGKEKEALKGKGNDNDANILSNVMASTFFQNRYPTTSSPLYGGDYTGGYEDCYVGLQYIWPSMNQSQRACIVAENGVLWDGVTTIGDGIRNAAKADGKDATYSSNGSEYIGLHQFVFAKADVTAKKTDEWDMSKYSDGKWHSICLPLNITKAEMKEIFGHDKDGSYNIRLCKFSKVTRISEGEKKHLTLFFNDEKFENAQDGDIVLEAHVSYMIKAKKENAVDGENIVLKNYQIVAGNPVPTNVTVDESDTETETASDDEGVSTQSTYQYYFIGNYLPNICMPQYCYFFSKQKSLFRFQQGTTAKWNAYTSIVEAPEGTKDNELYFSGSSSNGGEDNAKLYTAFDPEDEDNNTTAIDRVTIIADGEIVSTNDNVYNLNGQLVSTNGRTGLPKGIYVQGGKKYIVK